MKRTVQLLIGLAVGLGLLWLMFRDTKWPQVWAAAEGAHPGWMVLVVLLVLATFVTRIWRWGYIVRTAKPVSFRHMFNATQIGFLANFTLPGRVGELIRAMILGRLAQLPVSKCLAMVALDRVTDLIGLLAVIAVTVFAYAPEGNVVIPAETLGREISFSATTVEAGEIGATVSLFVIVFALVMLYVKQTLMLRFVDALAGLVSERLARWAHRMLEQFAEGLHVFRSGSDMAKSVFFSLVTWGLFLAIQYAGFAAFEIQGPWYTPFVIQVLLAVAISIPGAPGFVGQFHAPIIIGLMMLVPGMEGSKAKAYAIVLHLLNILPVYAVGVACLLHERVGLFALTRESAQVEATLETPEDGSGEP